MQWLVLPTTTIGCRSVRLSTDKPLSEKQVLSLVLSSDSEDTHLVRTALGSLSEGDWGKLDQAYKCARFIYNLHTKFTANSDVREENNSELRDDLPSPWHSFRKPSQEYYTFKEQYPNVVDYEDDGAASDRYWTLLFSLVVYVNKHFNQGGILQAGEKTKLRDDGTFDLDKASKLHPLVSALNTFGQTYAAVPGIEDLPSDQNHSLPVKQAGLARRFRDLEAENEAPRRQLEHQKEMHRHSLEAEKQAHLREVETDKEALRHRYDALEAKYSDLATRYEEREESLDKERAYTDKVRASFEEDLEIQSAYGEYLLEEGSLAPERAPQLHAAMANAMLRLTGQLPREHLLQDELPSTDRHSSSAKLPPTRSRTMPLNEATVTSPARDSSILSPSATAGGSRRRQKRKGASGRN